RPATDRRPVRYRRPPGRYRSPVRRAGWPGRRSPAARASPRARESSAVPEAEQLSAAAPVAAAAAGPVAPGAPASVRPGVPPGHRAADHPQAAAAGAAGPGNAGRSRSRWPARAGSPGAGHRSATYEPWSTSMSWVTELETHGQDSRGWTAMAESTVPRCRARLQQEKPSLRPRSEWADAREWPRRRARVEGRARAWRRVRGRQPGVAGLSPVMTGRYSATQ